MRCALGLALLLLGCGSGERSFEAPVTLGEREVAPEVLNLGEFVYMQRCRGCHGMHGTGDGQYASSMDPRPADLTSTRFARISPQGLPSDEVIGRAITAGIEGTAMEPMPIAGDRLDAVVQYVKWLAPGYRVQ